MFAAVSTNGGTTWTYSTVDASPSTNIYDNVYSPAIALHRGTVYLAYVWANDTNCATIVCSPFLHGYSSWIASTTNGSIGRAPTGSLPDELS